MDASRSKDLRKRIDRVKDELAPSLPVHPTYGKASLTVTQITVSPPAFNVVPEECRFVIDCRNHPGFSAKDLYDALNAIIDDLAAGDPDFKAELTRHSASNPLDIPLDSEIVTTLKSILGTKPVGAPYYTEAVSYTSAGIPAVICGPGSIDQAHTPDEYISLEQLDLGYKTYKELVNRTCL